MQFKHRMAMAVTVALAAVAASPAIHAAPHARPAPRHSASQGLQAPPESGYCDPFADWDWEYYKDKPLIGGAVGKAGRAASGWAVPGHADAAGTAARVIGTTPEVIERNFVRVVTRNLDNAGTASRVARLSERELDGIARHAAQGTPVDRAALLKLFATRLDGASLVRVAHAFGRAPVEAAVRTYADPATRAAFAIGIAGLVPPPPEGGGGGGTTPYPSPSPPRPTVDMTLEEIYLEFRTAPVGSLSPAGALAETAQFAGMRLSAAGWAGTAIGTGLSWLIQHYAPDLDNAIGATIATMIDNFWSASNEVQQGHYEAAFDDLFGFQVTWSSNPWGDWDIDTPMVSYYQSSGTCGW
jgi:hypothetical protein